MGSGHTWGPKDTDFKSPLARARGKGANAGAPEEWLKESFAFVIWVPLTIYVAISLFSGVASSYINMRAWLSSPISVSLLFSAILAASIHRFEVVTVIKDYVHNHVAEIILTFIVKIIFIAMVIFSAFSILMISL